MQNNEYTVFFNIIKVSAISSNVTFRSSKTILWIFLIFSGITADFLVLLALTGLFLKLANRLETYFFGSEELP